MLLANRNAFMLKPKQPYMDWAISLDDEVHLSTAAAEEYPVYLVPEFGTRDDFEKWLKPNYRVIFENELRGTWEDESDWPPITGYGMFGAWFGIDFGSEVFDLGSRLLVTEILP
jgi:hypothetical protein